MTDTVSNSLLSLSLAAAQSDPLPPSPLAPTGPSLPPFGATPATATRSRRLSSTGATRRRMSDAREAGIRNSQGHIITGLSNAAAALSLSSSPPITTRVITSGTTPTSSGPSAFVRERSSEASSMSTPLASSVPTGGTAYESVFRPRVTTHASGHQSLNGVLSVGALEEIPSSNSTITGSKKKGTIFRCESCSKVYRHPSCLVKHRWEHSPHWKEANKFLLSKHQQVQLLEAAAILSHITPGAMTGAGGPATSLPDDRSLWPSYLSVYVHPNTAAGAADLSGNGKLSDDRLGGTKLHESDGEYDEEAIDDEYEVDDVDEIGMDFDNTATLTMGPISSSVPIASPMLLGTKQLSIHGAGHSHTTGHQHHHRTRSRSRSISKSVHRNVLMTFRGVGKKDDGGNGGGGAATPHVSTEGMVVSAKPMTLRPGLIAVPAAAAAAPATAHRHLSPDPSSVKDWTSLATSPNSRLTPPLTVNPGGVSGVGLQYASSSSSYTPPISLAISNTRTSGSLSVPRSSLRSSSIFTEAETEPESSLDEDAYISSGSDGGAGRGKVFVVHEKKEEEWDGMEMEMDMGY